MKVARFPLFCGVLIAALLLLLLYFSCHARIDESMEARKTNKYNVIFAGTCKNVEPHLETNLDHIEMCAKKFHDYAVVIYENDSTDDTRNILLRRKKSNYEYIFEDNVTEPLRTLRLAHGRNRILEKVWKLNADNYFDYLIMMDLDDVNADGTFVSTISECFEQESWDVVSANQSDTYYDWWALRLPGFMNYDCWIPDSDQDNCYSFFGKRFEQEKGWIAVDSAFGGMAIYNLKTIPKTCRYQGIHPDGNEKCEHVDFHKCIKDHGGKQFINTRFINGDSILSANNEQTLVTRKHPSKGRKPQP